MSRNDNYKVSLLNIIHRHIPSYKVYLFGSRARGTHQEGADINIAIDSGNRIEFSLLSKIINAIEESSIPVLVDLVDYHAISDDMRKEIDHEGILWAN